MHLLYIGDMSNCYILGSFAIVINWGDVQLLYMGEMCNFSVVYTLVQCSSTEGYTLAQYTNSSCR